MKRVLALFVFSCILFSGCGKKSPSIPSCSVIQSITVIENDHGTIAIHLLDKDHQISSVMEQFRHKATHEQFYPPEIIPGRISSMVVTCANGDRHIYEALDGIYFRKDHGFWKRMISG